MSTIKLKYFEHAGHARKRQGDASSPHLYSALDTPNGFAFIIAGNKPEADVPNDMAAIAIERMNYYLVNEVTDDTAEAVRNAVIYANGFIHVLAERNPEMKLSELSCLCVLVKDNAAYYAWLGQVCLYLFTGRKLLSLAWDLYLNDDQENPIKPLQKSYLGEHQMVSPGVSSQPLCPVDGDILLMASSGLCVQYDENYVKKVLEDSMPTHTKASRLLSKIDEHDLPASCQLIRFYNIQNEVRSFVPAKQIDYAEKEASIVSSTNKLLSKPLVRMGLAIVALLALSYMVYDLFLFDPRPASRIQIVETTTGDDTTAMQGGRSPEISDQNVGVPPGRSTTVSNNNVPASTEAQTRQAIPADKLYTVKSGDNWSVIYREFEVCSWFIRNHPPNVGRLGPSNNLIAGRQIYIPVVYSARSSLNPAFYQEFSITKVGGSCQNVDADFLNNFKQKLGGNI